MNIRPLLVSLAALALSLGGRPLSAAEAPAKPQPSYTVVLEVTMDENGKAEGAKVVSSDDTSVDQVLIRNALKRAKDITLAPRLKDGKAVKFTAQAPFHYTVVGDEGLEANNAPKPKIAHAVQPVYPAELAKNGEVGGVILELIIGADGKVSNIKTLRSSDPASEEAATVALKEWTFVPAMQDDKPIASRWRMSISFETDVLALDWTWHVAPRPSLGDYTVVHPTVPNVPAAAAAPAQPATPPADK